MSPAAEELIAQCCAVLWVLPGLQLGCGGRGCAGAALCSQLCAVLGQPLFTGDSSTLYPCASPPRSSGLCTWQVGVKRKLSLLPVSFFVISIPIVTTWGFLFVFCIEWHLLIFNL